MAKRRNDRLPRLRVAPIGEMRFYLVSEEELEALGRGSLGSVFFNLALALLPVSVAFFLTLLSTEIKSTAVLFAFISGCVACLVAGVICAVLAFVHHSGTSETVRKIKDRMPPMQQEEPAEPPSPPTA